jgi:hypothetical protein
MDNVDSKAFLYMAVMTAYNITLAICMIGLGLSINIGMPLSFIGMMLLIWHAKRKLVGTECLWKPPQKDKGND